MRSPLFPAVALVALSIVAASMLPAPDRARSAPAPTLVVRNALVSAQCAGPSVTATFALPSSESLRVQFRAVPRQIWVDISLYGDTYPPGWFVGNGPHAPGAQFAWNGLLPGYTHWYRINGLFADGWKGIGGGAFQSPDCQTILGMRCDRSPTADDTSIVTFRVPPAPGTVQQWIDVSLNAFSFRAAEFASAGPFSPDGAVFDWAGLRYGRPYNYRFNAMFPNGAWVVQVAGAFRAPDCRNLP